MAAVTVHRLVLELQKAARGSPRRARRHSQSRAEKRMMRRICQGRGAPAARPMGACQRNVVRLGASRRT
ncbi:hypothetical protein SAMCFNEI73_Ch1256 [Sinorhizobium americanum]|uniref:Uncharacterized protein n=1 Tax=Sinorhizobium americanum TaxID=194963 RepID=A0A1L3LKD8_9HYPH|nr:hypothetical protein SAMCCGM7_Ch1246 [Sinorhizobium americanum CCGM7]APG90569.1 hypothetical protein SAMCFNEI73_Ch1256 [Sinorhizobium americanum]